MGVIGKRYPGYYDKDDSGFAAINGAHDGTSFADAMRLDRGTKSANQNKEKLIRTFPEGRLAQYPILETMIRDPINEAAVTMHVHHALSSKTQTGEVIFIEPKDGVENDKIVTDLQQTFSGLLNNNLVKWGFLTSLYGYYAPRVFGKKGEGVVRIMDDFYTNPRFIREYIRGGELAGFSHYYQQNKSRSGKTRLIEPWKFVPFSIQQHTLSKMAEPLRMKPFDIEDDDFENDEPIETTSYGSSLMSTAYDPWMDFNDSLLSLSLSRKNASKRDRFVGVETGKAHPVKAAQYYNMIAEQLQRKASESAQRSLRDGYVSAVDNHIFPIWSNGNGRVNIQTEESPVDVSGVEDVNMHLNRLCAAHGLDKSLLGWGDSMSGGLGEGGFFRHAITAAIRGNQIRSGVTPALEALFDIHVAFKWGKVFAHHDKPWQLKYNSLNTAIQNEESEAREREAMYATSVATLMQILDPEMTKFGFEGSSDLLLSQHLGIDPDTVKKIIAEGKKQPQPKDEQEGKNTPISDSFDDLSQDEKIKLIVEAIDTDGD